MVGFGYQLIHLSSDGKNNCYVLRQDYYITISVFGFSYTWRIEFLYVSPSNHVTLNFFRGVKYEQEDQMELHLSRYEKFLV